MTAPAKLAHEVMAICRQAAAVNRSASSRQGNVVVISSDDADNVLVAADLHGNRRNYERLLKVADLDANPRRHLVMQEVCHGGPTYPSGTGCMSHLLLEDMARLKTQYPARFHYLLSNHELAELIDYPIVKAGRMLNLLFRCGTQQMYGTLAAKVRDGYLEFLKSLPLAVRMTNGLFVSHSIPEQTDQQPFDVGVFERDLEPADWAEGGAAFRLVWGRDYRPENADRFAEMVGSRLLITGHEPCGDGYQVPNSRQVIIDTQLDDGCYVILPTSEELSQAQIIERIARLD
jgi:hypothetical protein